MAWAGVEGVRAQPIRGGEAYLYKLPTFHYDLIHDGWQKAGREKPAFSETHTRQLLRYGLVLLLRGYGDADLMQNLQT